MNTRPLWAIPALLLLSAPVQAEDYVLTLKDHVFAPAELTLPAGQKIKLTVRNQDATPAEFESHDLKREKVIQGGREASITLGPLKPGSYTFFDEFHEDTAKGTITVK